MTETRIRRDYVHTYAARPRATEVKPGIVFWNESRKGWTFNVLIDGVTVRSSYLYPREHIAREAMRLEVDSILATLKVTSDAIE